LEVTVVERMTSFQYRFKRVEVETEYIVDIDRIPNDFPVLECREQEMR
jgi:hypothetical protein